MVSIPYPTSAGDAKTISLQSRRHKGVNNRFSPYGEGREAPIL
jgi:hypothetical protein